MTRRVKAGITPTMPGCDANAHSVPHKLHTGSTAEVAVGVRTHSIPIALDIVAVFVACSIAYPKHGASVESCITVLTVRRFFWTKIVAFCVAHAVTKRLDARCRTFTAVAGVKVAVASVALLIADAVTNPLRIALAVGRRCV